MRKKGSILLSAALLAGSAGTLLVNPHALNAQEASSQSALDRERATQAYRDGYQHGQNDARAGVRNDSPGDRWTLESDQTAWRDGYSAGYQQVGSNPSSSANSPGAMNSDPERFGYQDGLAQGRKDRQKGDKFRPTNGHFYKDADHGWSSAFPDKDHYKEIYRQAYANGYEEGYKGSGSSE